MHREEPELTLSCAACGAIVDPETDRAPYDLDLDRVLCWRCATKRGGVWDADEERWVEAPDASGISTPEQE